MANPESPDFAASAAGEIVVVCVSSVYLRVKPLNGSLRIQATVRKPCKKRRDEREAYKARMATPPPEFYVRPPTPFHLTDPRGLAFPHHRHLASDGTRVPHIYCGLGNPRYQEDVEFGTLTKRVSAPAARRGRSFGNPCTTRFPGRTSRRPRRPRGAFTSDARCLQGLRRR